MYEKITLPFDPQTIATLEGVLIGDFEPTAETLIFQFVRGNGERFQLDLHEILQALIFCSETGAIPPLSFDWVNQAAAIHGKVFQENA
ncbi:hypothetical protein [Rhizobium sp. LCM 4573]|uniref:hypothetical protein n=1 Tax=Rhizobium sp. LCM 4573 TaxID=1848291 RepID=UPI0008DB23A9|nr:hypothetical protein [Rhizobium sp. LCM 4573]OHV82624.1 hypothetical protein LCM4573_16645 [Rhizobium sp. LCM 4573]